MVYSEIMNKVIKTLALVFGLIIVILVLGIIFVNVWSDKQTNNPDSQVNQTLTKTAKDMQRKNSVGAIWGAAQYYRQKNGNYPTNEVVNSQSFQTEYGLTSQITQDPEGSSSIIGSSAAKGSYSYAPTAADGSACDNVAKACTKVKVTAILNDGTEHSLSENQ